MSNPAFIVEGHTEKRIIELLCPGQPIRLIGINGENVKLTAIARNIGIRIRELGNRHYPIVIIIDKESRTMSFLEMALALNDLLIHEGFGDQDLRIGVPDKKIENWFIADWKSICEEEPYPLGMADMQNSLKWLKHNFGGYIKAVDGPSLFCKSNPVEACRNSTSYKHFVDQILDIKCHYYQEYRQQLEQII